MGIQYTPMVFNNISLFSTLSAIFFTKADPTDTVLVTLNESSGLNTASDALSVYRSVIFGAKVGDSVEDISKASTFNLVTLQCVKNNVGSQFYTGGTYKILLQQMSYFSEQLDDLYFLNKKTQTNSEPVKVLFKKVGSDYNPVILNDKNLNSANNYNYVIGIRASNELEMYQANSSGLANFAFDLSSGSSTFNYYFDGSNSLTIDLTNFDSFFQAVFVAKNLKTDQTWDAVTDNTTPTAKKFSELFDAPSCTGYPDVISPCNKTKDSPCAPKSEPKCKKSFLTTLIVIAVVVVLIFVIVWLVCN